MSHPEIALRVITQPRGLHARLRELAKAAAILLAVYLPLQWVAHHYRIVFDSIRGANCLPYSVFLIDLKDKQVRRGDLIAFVAQQMEPFYRNGTQAVKLLAAIPGDHITVDEHGVSINGQHCGELVHAKKGGKLWQLGRRPSDYFRDESVPARHLWMMGTYPRSYDSRYWGYISDEQIVGRAIPLW